MPVKLSVFFLLALTAGTIEWPTEGWADRPVVEDVAIVVSKAASEPIQVAADELARSLHRLYPGTGFQVTRRSVLNEAVVYVGTPPMLPQLAAFRDDKRLSHAESYIVTSAQIEGRKCGIIVGSDSAGVVYGVYGLLKRLGYGFYLSYDTVPAVGDRTFAFDHWDVADYPLVPNRIVFDWHNFLSGCSTWNLADWQSWIIQSQKMGYNAIMVHAYGNNPMAGFQFAGQQKPVGYLSSTRVGRDWSTNHVNDVRRLWGGDVFAEPVFGSVAAIKGTDAERTQAAQQMMEQVFATAERRGVRVVFAVDVDTTSANPQELIRKLPERARFQIDVPSRSWMGQPASKAWLADPDTEEGYAFYKAQVSDLLTHYPADRLARRVASCRRYTVDELQVGRNAESVAARLCTGG